MRPTAPKNTSFLVLAGIISLLLSGCLDSLEKQTKKSKGSIIGKKTQKVKEFDPNAKQEVSDSDVNVSPSPTYALEAYRPAVEQLMKSHVKHAVDLFHAMHDRYPKDHAEFMSQIIKANNIQLPVLPGGYEYAYDVENHKLEVVKSLEAEPGEAKEN